MHGQQNIEIGHDLFLITQMWYIFIIFHHKKIYSGLEFKRNVQ